MYCVELSQEREMWRRKRPPGRRCTVREEMALVLMRLVVRTTWPTVESEEGAWNKKEIKECVC